MGAERALLLCIKIKCYDKRLDRKRETCKKRF